MTTEQTVRQRIAEVEDLGRVIPERWARTYGYPEIPTITPDLITEWVREERSERVRAGA